MTRAAFVLAALALTVFAALAQGQGSGPDKPATSAAPAFSVPSAPVTPMDEETAAAKRSDADEDEDEGRDRDEGRDEDEDQGHGKGKHEGREHSRGHGKGHGLGNTYCQGLKGQGGPAFGHCIAAKAHELHGGHGKHKGWGKQKKRG